MKLKYYFRGLGAGILFTAIVFSFVVLPKSRMTDDEIKTAAAELGMVEGENDDIDLNAINLTPTATPVITATVTPTEIATPTISSAPEATKEATPTLTITVTPEPTVSVEATLTPTPTIKPTLTPTPVPTSTLTPTPTVTSTPIPTHKPTLTPTPTVIITLTPTPTVIAGNGDTDISETISVTVVRGMTSESFARLLYEKKLIDDSEDFNHFMVINDYANYIRVGTFEIPAGSTYKEIAYIVTNIR